MFSVSCIHPMEEPDGLVALSDLHLDYHSALIFKDFQEFGAGLLRSCSSTLWNTLCKTGVGVADQVKDFVALF